MSKVKESGLGVTYLAVDNQILLDILNVLQEAKVMTDPIAILDKYEGALAGFFGSLRPVMFTGDT